jgi:hypothetical protein
LVPGMQVMILENIFPNLLVMNGSIGTVVLTSPPSNNLSNAYLGILFPWLADAGVQFPGLPLGTLLFKPRTQKFTYTPPGKSPIDIHRTQFPITIAKAVTVHKFQGQTARGGAVVCYSSQYSIDMLYVALSRVESLSRLVIDGPLTLSALTKPWSASLKEHILHLKMMQASTLEFANRVFPHTLDVDLLNHESALETIELQSLLAT